MIEYILRTDLGYYGLVNNKNNIFCERLDNRPVISFLNEDEEDDIVGESFSGYVESILRKIDNKRFRFPITRYDEKTMGSYFERVEVKVDNIRPDSLLLFTGINETIGLVRNVYRKV